MIATRAPSVRTQFVLVALLSLAMAGVVTLIYIPQFQADILAGEFERRIRDLSTLATEQGAIALPRDDFESLNRVAARLAADSQIQGAQFFDTSKGVVASAGQGLHLKVRPRWLEWPEPQLVRSPKQLIIVTPIRDAGRRVGTLLVLANRVPAMAWVSQQSRFVASLLIVSVILGVLVALLFGALLQRRISRLRDAAERVANGDFDLRIPFQARDEIGELYGSFNRMVEQLKRTTTSRDALSREVLERRRAYERIRTLKDKAEEAARIKSEFLANMSHEIRTPMNGVIGMTDLTLDTDLSAEQREYLNMARVSAESLLAIIDDILDFSKIEAGRLSLDPVEVELSELVGVTLRTLAVKSHEKGLDLIGSIDPEVPARVILDPVRLRQVLVNLVGNAVKFTERGEIVTRVGVESIDGNRAVLHFSVEDTGIGIPPERRETIFEAFSQADGSTTRKYGGTGLGLSISAQLVDLMGGLVWVDSEPGRGSTFHFTVECGLAAEEEDPATQRYLLGRKATLVLANGTERTILQSTLESWGLSVTAFEQPTLALEHLTNPAHQPALMIVDYQMHEQDGLEFVSELTQRTGFDGHIVLLKFSGSLQFVGAHSREFGITATLNKPVLPEELRTVVLECLREGGGAIAAPSADAEESAATDSLRILLAEDNPVNQKLAVRMLEKRGHVVIAVPDGARALDLATQEQFDLVLMDVQMPQMGGLEATRRIREHERHHGGHVPIVAMTANTYDDDRRSCLEAGMDGYVGKPVKPAVLFGEIERVVVTA